MRNIKYVKKNVKAGTEYRSTSKDDLNMVLDQCRRIIEVTNACEKDSNKDLQNASSKLNSRNPNIPRQSGGKVNSVKTMCEGTLDNFANGQYDLSIKTCAGVQEAFRIAASIFDEFEEVTFEEVIELPKLVAPVASSGSLNELWDQYEIVTTIRKKA